MDCAKKIIFSRTKPSVGKIPFLALSTYALCILIKGDVL